MKHDSLNYDSLKNKEVESMNPDHRDTSTASERALKDWKRKIPLNRAGRRDQLSRYKYYLELNESDTFWSVYAVKKDGNKVMVDNSANHEPKYDVDDEISTESVDVVEETSANIVE
jgi:hypothetical protein